MAEQILMARNGALFVQTDGPNTKPEYVGCVDVDAIAEPGGGIDTLIRCFRADGQGWETIAATLTPPDPVTTTITALATATQSFLELIKTCPANFFLMQETGRPTVSPTMCGQASSRTPTSITGASKMRSCGKRTANQP